MQLNIRFVFLLARELDAVAGVAQMTGEVASGLDAGIPLGTLLPLQQRGTAMQPGNYSIPLINAAQG